MNVLLAGGGIGQNFAAFYQAPGGSLIGPDRKRYGARALVAVELDGLDDARRGVHRTQQHAKLLVGIEIGDQPHCLLIEGVGESHHAYALTRNGALQKVEVIKRGAQVSSLTQLQTAALQLMLEIV